jgi:cell division protein FtsB
MGSAILSLVGRALLGLLKAMFSDWLNREKARGEGRAEVQRELEAQAEALRQDYDEIHADDRSITDALGRLRQRSGARTGDRRLP